MAFKGSDPLNLPFKGSDPLNPRHHPDVRHEPSFWFGRDDGTCGEVLRKGDALIFWIEVGHGNPFKGSDPLNPRPVVIVALGHVHRRHRVHKTPGPPAEERGGGGSAPSGQRTRCRVVDALGTRSQC